MQLWPLRVLLKAFPSEHPGVCRLSRLRVEQQHHLRVELRYPKYS